jgi:hypothetical protein
MLSCFPKTKTQALIAVTGLSLGHYGAQLFFPLSGPNDITATRESSDWLSRQQINVIPPIL